MTLSSRLATVTQSHSVIYKGGNGRTIKAKANGSDIFLTCLVTIYGETNGYDVDPAGASEPVSGVVVCQYTPYLVNLAKDSDSCFTDNTDLGVYIPEVGDQLYLTVATAQSITKGNYFKVTTGGFIVQGTKGTSLGRVLAVITGASGYEKIVLCEWGEN